MSALWGSDPFPKGPTASDLRARARENKTIEDINVPCSPDRPECVVLGCCNDPADCQEDC